MDVLPNPDQLAYRLVARNYTLATFNTGVLKDALGTHGDFGRDFSQTRWYIQHDMPFADGLPISDDKKKSVAMLDQAETLPGKMLDSSGPEIANIFYGFDSVDNEQRLEVAKLFGGIPSRLESYIAHTAVDHIKLDLNTNQAPVIDDLAKKLGPDFVDALTAYDIAATELWLRNCVDVMYVEESNDEGYSVAKVTPAVEGNCRSTEFVQAYIQTHNFGEQIEPRSAPTLVRLHISETGLVENTLDPTVITKRMASLAVDLAQLGSHA